MQAGIDDGTYSEAGFTIISVDTATPGPSTGLSTGAVVGIVIAAIAGSILLFILVTACIFIYCWCVILFKHKGYDRVTTLSSFNILIIAETGLHERARKANMIL